MQGCHLAALAFSYSSAMVQLLTLPNANIHSLTPALLPVGVSAHRQLLTTYLETRLASGQRIAVTSTKQKPGYN